MEHSSPRSGGDGGDHPAGGAIILGADGDLLHLHKPPPGDPVDRPLRTTQGIHQDRDGLDDVDDDEDEDFQDAPDSAGSSPNSLLTSSLRKEAAAAAESGSTNNSRSSQGAAPRSSTSPTPSQREGTPPLPAYSPSLQTPPTSLSLPEQHPPILSPDLPPRPVKPRPQSWEAGFTRPPTPPRPIRRSGPAGSSDSVALTSTTLLNADPERSARSSEAASKLSKSSPSSVRNSTSIIADKPLRPPPVPPGKIFRRQGFTDGGIDADREDDEDVDDDVLDDDDENRPDRSSMASFRTSPPAYRRRRLARASSRRPSWQASQPHHRFSHQGQRQLQPSATLHHRGIPTGHEGSDQWNREYHSHPQEQQSRRRALSGRHTEEMRERNSRDDDALRVAQSVPHSTSSLQYSALRPHPDYIQQQRLSTSSSDSSTRAVRGRGLRSLRSHEPPRGYGETVEDEDEYEREDNPTWLLIERGPEEVLVLMDPETGEWRRVGGASLDPDARWRGQQIAGVPLEPSRSQSSRRSNLALRTAVSSHRNRPPPRPRYPDSFQVSSVSSSSSADTSPWSSGDIVYPPSSRWSEEFERTNAALDPAMRERILDAEAAAWRTAPVDPRYDGLGPVDHVRYAVPAPASSRSSQSSRPASPFSTVSSPPLGPQLPEGVFHSNDRTPLRSGVILPALSGNSTQQWNDWWATDRLGADGTRFDRPSGPLNIASSPPLSPRRPRRTPPPPPAVALTSQAVLEPKAVPASAAHSSDQTSPPVLPDRSHPRTAANAAPVWLRRILIRSLAVTFQLSLYASLIAVAVAIRNPDATASVVRRLQSRVESAVVAFLAAAGRLAAQSGVAWSGTELPLLPAPPPPPPPLDPPPLPHWRERLLVAAARMLFGVTVHVVGEPVAAAGGIEGPVAATESGIDAAATAAAASSSANVAGETATKLAAAAAAAAATAVASSSSSSVAPADAAALIRQLAPEAAAATVADAVDSGAGADAVVAEGRLVAAVADLARRVGGAFEGIEGWWRGWPKP